MAHVENLRRYFPAVWDNTYLNTGTFGLLPQSAVTAMKDTLTWQLEKGRRQDNYVSELVELRQTVREQLGFLFHAQKDNFALTDSTTHGVNIILNGLNFREGDEVIVTDTEHPGTLLPIFNQKHRQHIGIRFASCNHGVEALCASVESQISNRTRLIVASHVSYQTGFRLPIEELTKIAHRYHVLILIDGAQGAGAEFMDLTDLDCDFYVFPGQKWLCGPDGTGALYIRKELLSLLDIPYIGVQSLQSRDAFSQAGDFTSVYSARRFEHSVTHMASWRGLSESIQFLKNVVGFDYLFTRVNGLTALVMDELLNLDGVELVTPRGARCGLVHFRFQNMDATRLAEELMSRQIIVKPISQTRTIRVSPHFYNSEDDIERLIHALKTM